MNGMMPPGGGGGGDLAAQLMQLIQTPAAQQIMSSPKGQQMVQAIMGQMGGGGMPSGGGVAGMMGGGGMTGGPNAGELAAGPLMGRSGPATDGELDGMAETRNQMRPDMPPMPSTEDEMAMVQQNMGGPQAGQLQNAGGGGGMNSDGPTPEEIKMLQSSPSPRNVANFEKLFGPGSAQQYLGGGGGAPSPTGGSTYEEDVAGAMDDAEDPGDHEYR